VRVALIPVEFRTFSEPKPSTNGLPTGPGAAPPSRAPLILSGLAPGLNWRSMAAAPLVMAALNEVPEPTKLAAPMRADG
jgi:hypothetical protein